MIAYHQDQKQYICQKPQCDKIFDTEDDLIEHVKQCFSCSKCGKYFGSVEGFKNHQCTYVKSDNASFEPGTLSKSHFSQCGLPDLIKGVQSNTEKSDQESKEILEDEIIPIETDKERNFNHTILLGLAIGLPVNFCSNVTCSPKEIILNIKKSLKKKWNSDFELFLTKAKKKLSKNHFTRAFKCLLQKMKVIFVVKGIGIK